MDRLEDLERRLARFARERGWGRYHNPKNLAMAMVKEAAEVVELYQWLTPAQARRPTPRQRARLADELADTFAYLLMLARANDIDLVDAAKAKLRKNARRYPASRR